MKRIIHTLMAIALTVGAANAQTLIERSDGTFTQGDTYLAALKTLSIPYGASPTFDGGLARDGSLFFNTTTDKLVIWTGEAWEDVGKETDLSDYYTEAQVDALLEAYATTSAMNSALADKVDKTTTVAGKALSGNITLSTSDIDGLAAALAGKQATVTGAASTIVDANLSTNRALISNGSGKVAVSATTANELSYVSGVTSSIQSQLNDRVPLSQKGANNGVAPLNASGKIPAQYVDVSGMEYMGTWNAATNTPTLADGTGISGQYYRVTTGGTRNLGSGSITFVAGDDVLHNGSIWQRVPSVNLVSSVNGQQGAVVLGKADVGLGNVDNTSDLAKPVSNATQSALDGKENAFSKNTGFNKNFGTAAGTIAQGNDSRINNGQTAYEWGDYRIFGLGGSSTNITSLSDFNLFDRGTSFIRASSGDNTPFFGAGVGFHNRFSAQRAAQFWIPITSNNSLQFRSTGSDGIWGPVRTVWHDGNFDPADYMTTNSNQIVTHWKRWVMNTGSSAIDLKRVSGDISPAIRWMSPEDGVETFIRGHSGALSFGTGWATERFRIESTEVRVAGSIPIANARIPTANDHLVNKAYVDGTISGLSAKSESVTVSAAPSYTLTWNSTYKGKFGPFGTFEVWLNTSGSNYVKQDVPIAMSTSSGEASSYTFTLSNVAAIIVIK